MDVRDSRIEFSTIQLHCTVLNVCSLWALWALLLPIMAAEPVLAVRQLDPLLSRLWHVQTSWINSSTVLGWLCNATDSTSEHPGFDSRARFGGLSVRSPCALPVLVLPPFIHSSPPLERSRVTFSGDPSLPAVMSVSVCGCLSLYVALKACPGWSCLLPHVSQDRLHPPPAPCQE